MRKLGDTIHYDFTTHSPTTGAVTDADSTPTSEVFEDDNDTPILSPTVTKRTGKTGNYRVPIAATSGNNFGVGRSYNVIVSATVNTVVAKARIASFTLDSKRIGDLNDLSQAQILSDATPFAGASVAAIKAKTDLIPATPADQVTSLTIKAKTDLIPATPADQVTSLAIKAKTDLIPSDIGDLPTDAELSAEHGVGSWEKGAEFNV